jgi:hypothetical protein
LLSTATSNAPSTPSKLGLATLKVRRIYCIVSVGLFTCPQGLRSPAGKELRRALHPIVTHIVASACARAAPGVQAAASAASACDVVAPLLALSDNAPSALSNRISTAFRARNWQAGQASDTSTLALNSNLLHNRICKYDHPNFKRRLVNFAINLSSLIPKSPSFQ